MPQTWELDITARLEKQLWRPPVRYSKFSPLLHPLTSFRHGLPVARYRVIEANQLQYLVMFRSEFCLQFLSQCHKPRVAPHIFKNSLVKWTPLRVFWSTLNLGD